MYQLHTGIPHPFRRAEISRGVIGFVGVEDVFSSQRSIALLSGKQPRVATHPQVCVAIEPQDVPFVKRHISKGPTSA